MDIIHDFYEIYKYCFFLHIIPQGLANIGLTKRIMQDILLPKHVQAQPVTFRSGRGETFVDELYRPSPYNQHVLT